MKNNSKKGLLENFSQKPLKSDRMKMLDNESSSMGGKFEKRNEFSRDRDRIIHSKAFRRLQHKAQVYSPEKGDHYRTRLTHTLEVNQIARGISKNLGVNENLTEAIALGHDIGHTPFGHAGEEILDEIMRGKDNLGGKFKYNIDFGGFKHNFNSVKILDIVEKKYSDDLGLNLTWQVLEGILKHTKIQKNDEKGNVIKKWNWNRFVNSPCFFEDFFPYDFFDDNYNNEKAKDFSITLEGQIVDIADEIAQIEHDLDDSFRYEYADKNAKRFFKLVKSLIEDAFKECSSNDSGYETLKDLKKNVTQTIDSNKDDDYRWNKIRGYIISYFIKDITENTYLKGKDNNGYIKKVKCPINSYYDSTPCNNIKEYERKYITKKLVCFSDAASSLHKKIESHINNRIINSYDVNRFDGKSKFIIRQLFKAYYENPKQMPVDKLKLIERNIRENSKEYFDISFKANNRKISDINFNSDDNNVEINLTEISKLIKLLKLELELEKLKSEFSCDLIFCNEIGLDTQKIDKYIKESYLNKNEKEKYIFQQILTKINSMSSKEISKINNKKIKFIKCLVENHYDFLSVICDFISMMTDNYAKDEYKRLYLV